MEAFGESLIDLSSQVNLVYTNQVLILVKLYLPSKIE